MRRLILIFAIYTGVLWGGPVGADDAFDKAYAAYNRGNYAEALDGFRVLAEQGSAKAQYNLGVVYNKGRGVAEDDAEAVKWWRKAAEQGHAKAQYNLGLMYDLGKGAPQNYVQAMKWYRKAAEQGNARAQYNLGVMYAKGEGVPRNYVQAHKWFNLAAEQGDVDGEKGRDLAASMMTPSQIEKAQTLAAEWRPKK